MFKNGDVLVTRCRVSHGITIPEGQICLVKESRNGKIQFAENEDAYFRYYQFKSNFIKIGEL